jgi:hypothetical protein
MDMSEPSRFWGGQFQPLTDASPGSKRSSGRRFIRSASACADVDTHAHFPTESHLEPRDDIWPTDAAPVIRQTDDGHEFIQLRWGFPPTKAKGAPIINSVPRNGAFQSADVGAGVSLLRVYGKKVAEDHGNSRKPERTGSALRACGDRCPEAATRSRY